MPSSPGDCFTIPGDKLDTVAPAEYYCIQHLGEHPMRRSWKAVLWSCFALCLYLTAESFLPAAHQPSSRLGVALLHAYQATGSPAMQACGVQCRYTPTCSHYAEDAISHYGTLNGLARTARCAGAANAGEPSAASTPRHRQLRRNPASASVNLAINEVVQREVPCSVWLPAGCPAMGR